jgi:hypothetical protein
MSRYSATFTFPLLFYHSKKLPELLEFIAAFKLPDIGPYPEPAESNPRPDTEWGKVAVFSRDVTYDDCRLFSLILSKSSSDSLANALFASGLGEIPFSYLLQFITSGYYFGSAKHAYKLRFD